MPEPNDFASQVVLDFIQGEDYDEPTFLYFLAVERARAEQSDRPIRLLFATLEPVPGHPVSISPPIGARLLRCLRMSVRETDVTGWYSQHRVAGALLSGRDDRTASDVASMIQRRVDEGLRRRLPARIARSLRVRVFPLLPDRFRTA